MKNLLLFLIAIVPVFASADCGDSYGNLVTAGCTGSFSLSDAVTTISDNAGCNKNWNDKYSCQVYIGSSSTSDYVLNQIANSGTISWAAVVARLYQVGGSASSGLSTSLRIEVKLDGPNWGWSDHSLDRFFNVTVYHAGSINLIPQTFCSGKPYLFDEIVTSPVQHVGKALTFSTGDNFSGTTVTFTQPVNNIVSVYYTATIAGYTVNRSWTVSMHELREGYFTDTPDNLSINSNNVDLGLYSYFSPGSDREFIGNGVYLFGNSWLFNPSLAGNGDHVLQMRVNNQGCYSEYRDTVFTVIGIASIVTTPILDFEQTFGAGETGYPMRVRYPPYIDYDGSPEPGFDGYRRAFHFACSNRNYTFVVANPLSNLIYEWAIYYHDLLYASGTGNTFVVNMPDRASVDENVYTGTQAFPFPDSTYIPYFMDGPGDYVTNYLGDMMRVNVRKKNIINEYSAWAEYYVGVVDSPVLESEERICYTTDPTLVSVADSPVYLSFPDETVIRSMRWDIDQDGDWEFGGDSINYNISNLNKVNLFNAQVVDSTKLWMYDETGGIWNSVTLSGIDEVCYSVIDTIKIVKSPEFNVSFNDVGQVNIGTPVRSIVTGSYFDPSVDEIEWSWSDGSASYFGDTLWHYLNDLGFYTLNVAVTDAYGCTSEQEFPTYWYVPGYLDLEEELAGDFSLFPVPVNDKLTITSSNPFETWTLYDMSGKVILNGSEQVIDLSFLTSGSYLLGVVYEKGIINKKIVKL